MIIITKAELTAGRFPKIEDIQKLKQKENNKNLASSGIRTYDLQVTQTVEKIYPTTSTPSLRSLSIQLWWL